MSNEILIVLGSPNSPSGELSSISISRLDYCLNHYSDGKSILCTGGWGKHFNTSKEAHASYAKMYLIEKGVSENDFLNFALSQNTVDDAVKIKAILKEFQNCHIKIITSDYHLDRVKIIFEEILTDFNLTYDGVSCELNKEHLAELVKHEKKSIQQILTNCLYY